MRARTRTVVKGIVQGVGFRPFVYQLARRLDLTGWVRNTSDGVIIEIEGERERLDEFLRLLRDNAPPASDITSVSAQDLPPEGERDFSIITSDGEERPEPVIPADIATCADCAREVGEETDRRFHYPFTNCTNCGPRFTIIQGIPYDRPKTTMSVFRMCSDCQHEYDAPTDRRFHAQPNACSRCGPRAALDGNTPAGADPAEPILHAGRLLAEGRIVAVKGLGGFHLACDARNADAVRALRQRKGRSQKPFALMVRDVAEAERLCFINDAQRRLLQSLQRPIVILRERPGGDIAREVAPSNLYLGLMLPYTPLHQMLFESAPPALVMTSGNLAEEPICHTNEQARSKLAGIADHFLTHDRDIHLPCDDSVARIVAGKPMLIRRSRGYVPRAIALPSDAPPVLAVGGEERNTFCMLVGDHAVLSQHIGDLDKVETLDYLEWSIEHLGELFRWRPEIVAYDLHPEYLSAKYALARTECKLVGVQHHHAHAASVMADCGVEGPVLAASLDGAGYGTDGAIWGGEFLLARLTDFERMAHLAYVPMPGGAAAVRRPGRMALAYLLRAYGDEGERAALDLTPHLDAQETRAAALQAHRGFNSPMTSSMGRLFDAVSALLGICTEATYTGQPAVELEMAAADVDSPQEAYRFEIDTSARPWQIDPTTIVRGVVDDIRRGAPPAEIAARFHHTVAALISEVCELMSRETGLTQVALGGGVFQNAYLLELLLKTLPTRGLEPLIHSQAPTNDGGLSLGQAVIAAAIQNQIMEHGRSRP
ncbi:MAG: carbamoyltransferase HypF [Armatimonadota bacterium]|nr:MAG: carbamoyltransferase HypF [Armatimonadota bacterium]